MTSEPESVETRRLRFVYEAARLQAMAVDAPVIPEPLDREEVDSLSGRCVLYRKKEGPQKR